MMLTGYVTSHVTKAESSGLQDVWEDLASSGSLYSRMWRFAKYCFKNRKVGLYEATDLLTGDLWGAKCVILEKVLCV